MSDEMAFDWLGEIMGRLMSREQLNRWVAKPVLNDARFNAFVRRLNKPLGTITLRIGAGLHDYGWSE